MITKRLIKTIPLSHGMLYGTANGRNNLIAKCEPMIEIFRQDNPVKILGKTSYALKSYHMALVLCQEPDFAPEKDYDFLKIVTAYHLTADVLLANNVIKELHLSNLYPRSIDPFGEWEFSVEDYEKVKELLSLDILE